MPEQDRILIVVAEWVEKAEHDLTAAACTLRMKRGCPTDAVCFHAQQCIEKYLKAMLVLRARPFPRTHDMWEILQLVPAGLQPTLSIAEARRMTEYATITRYPGDYEPIPVAEARKAVALARRVRGEVRKQLRPSRPRKRRG